MGSPQIPAAAGFAGAPRGASISCRGWHQEAVLRLLMNSADPEVAEYPPQFVASGCVGNATRDRANFSNICDELRALNNDETVLARRGAPLVVSRTSTGAPRAVILDSDPAAGWTYIGPQQFLAHYYELLGSMVLTRFGGTLAGKFVTTCGMSAAGGALVLAASFHGAASLGIEADAERVKRRVKTGYCDVMVTHLDEALRILKNAVRKREPASVGLVANCAEIVPEMASRGVAPDLLADFAAPKGDTPHSEAVASLKQFGTIPVDANAALPNGREAVRCVALSGEAADVRRLDQLILKMFSADESLCRWIALVQRRLKHQGLPARACYLTADERRELFAAINDLAVNGELKAPVAIVREDRVEPSEAVDADALLSPRDTHSLVEGSAALKAAALAKGAACISLHADSIISRVFVAHGENAKTQTP